MATYYLPASGGYNTSNEYIKYRIKIVEGAYNSSAKTMPVTISAQFWRTNTGYTTHMNGTCYCKINGTEYTQAVSYSNSAHAITYNSYTELFSKTVTISYANNGTGSLTTQAKINLTSSSTTGVSSSYQGGAQSLTSQTPVYKLTVNYYSNYATATSAQAFSEVSENTNVLVYTHYFYYNTTYLDGLLNYSASDNFLYLGKNGHTPTGYWGTETNGGKLVQEDTGFNTGQELAIALGTDISTGDKTINIYPQWTVNTYTNRIHHWRYVGTGGNNGDGTMYRDESTNEDTVFTAKYGDETPIYEGFAKSYTGYHCDNVAASNWGISDAWSGKEIGSTFVQPAANVTIEYYYYPNTVHIAYMLNGGFVTSSSYGDNGEGAVTYGGEPYFHSISYGSSADPYNAATFGLTKNGYTFAGWKVNSTGEILDQDTTYDSTVYAHYDDSSKTTENTENVHCYLNAQWTPNTYTVRYDANGGSGEMADSIATYDSEFITRKNTFTKIGYTFNGWNEKADGTGTSWDLTSSGVYEQGTYWKWNYTNNITLYAQWKPNIIKLTLDKAGGTGGTDEIYYYYGINTFYSDSACTNVVTTITRPTRTGYVFAHYAGDGSSGGDNGERYIAYNNIEFASDLCTDITKDATLYAVWKSNADQDVYICCDTGKIYARSYVISELFYINSGGDIYAPSFTVGSYFAIDANGITATEFIEGVPD